MERDERLADRDERGGVRAGARPSCRKRHDREEAEDADGDEDALEDAGGDKAEGEDFVLPLEDREQRDGGADVGDDEEQLQEGSQEHAACRRPAPMM